MLKYSNLRRIVPERVRSRISRFIWETKEAIECRARFAHSYAGQLGMRVYLNTPELRFIFCTGLPSHNIDGISGLGSRDVLLCMVPCFTGAGFYRRERRVIKRLGLSPTQVVCLHIQLARKFREAFVSLTGRLGIKRGVERDWELLFNDQFVHKMVGFRPTAEVVEELKS